LDAPGKAVIFVSQVARSGGLPGRAIAALLAFAAMAGCHSADNLFCDKTGCTWTGAEWARIQTLSPLPAPPPDPSNNYWNDPLAATLGQAFYFDTRFSGAPTGKDAIGRVVGVERTPAPGSTSVGVSCASCHDPRYAGTDVTSMPNTVSIGAGVYDVNSQQTVNAAFYPLLYWNGRSDSLWSQVLAVNTSAVSMNSTQSHDFWTIYEHYADQYNAVFADYPLPTDTTGFPADGSTMTNPAMTRVFVNFGKAIEAYEYRLITHGSAFDRFVAAGPGSGWISAQAEQGARLFVGKASCIDCHNGPMLSDDLFHDIAVPQSGPHVPTVADCPSTNASCRCTPGAEESTCLPSGAWAGAKKLAAAAYDRSEPGRTPEMTWSDAPDSPEPAATADIGASLDAGSAPNAQLKGAWRTPSLRDVAITAPYMHDGYYQTLSQVVQHYNHGGVAGAGTAFELPTCGTVPATPPDGGPETIPCNDAGAPQAHVAVQIKPLDLTDDEAAAIVAFLETLTSDPLPSALTTMPSTDGGSMDAHASPMDAHAPMDANAPSDGSPGQ
jgi:cytochrome c peroxidase